MFERTFSGVLGPHFAQLKHIGGGGSGSVYSGVDTRFDFPVCIKRLSVTNKDDCRTALREIRIRRRLRHENIVGLLNAITSEGTDVSEIAPAIFRDTPCIYLVQELLDADLRQVIESNNRLSHDYVKLFFYQLLRGVKYIHSANVLHRDLKPSNVMINVNSLELMIGDFGHSVVLDPDYNHSNCHSSCDTSLWYKAPELIVGSSQYSTASDMWAVGCVLAEMLLGRPLFEGENDLEQLELIIHTIDIEERDQIGVRQFLTEKVNEMYTGKPKFPLQSKFQKVDFHVLHLLEHLLSFNAADRVTAEQALMHPFLQEYSCAADEPMCLKPLHLEHEVDDFLEYTLKDLMVGECVALAEEQPRIHMQMSSYSSLMEIVKELNNSPGEKVPQSVEDGKSGITIKISSENERESGDVGRFKVLEVLKEEHTSSSDSNGIPFYEDCISEEPLISDHPTFSSLKWENERHKFGHRRHHSHHRKKSGGDESSRSRKRKISPGNKTHKSPNSEREIPSCSVPEGQEPGSLSPNLSSSNESRLSPGKLSIGESDSTVLGTKPGADEEFQDDKVKELISESSQLIANHFLDKSALSNELDVNASRSLGQSSLVPDSGHSSSEEDKLSGLGDSKDDVEYSATDSTTVAEVIRRSREILGDKSSSVDVAKENTLFNGGPNELISKSNQLIAEHFLDKSALLNKLDANRSETIEQPNSLLTVGCLQSKEEKHSGLGHSKNDVEYSATDISAVAEVIRRSRELLGELSSSVDVAKENTLPDGDPDDPVKDLILKSEQLLCSRGEKIGQETADKQEQVTVNHTQPPPQQQPESATDYTLQPMLSDPFHLRESNRRMQELFQESHTLLSKLRHNPEVSTSSETTSLEPGAEVSGRLYALPPLEGKFEAVRTLEVQSDPEKHNPYRVSKRTDQNSCSGSETQFPSTLSMFHGRSLPHTARDRICALEDELDVNEMSSVVAEAKRFLGEEGDSRNDSNQTHIPRVAELDNAGPAVKANVGEPENNQSLCGDVSLASRTASAKLDHATLMDSLGTVNTFDTESMTSIPNGGNEQIKESADDEKIIGKSEVPCLTTVVISEYENPLNFCRVFKQDAAIGVVQKAAILEPVSVSYTVRPLNEILVKNSVIRARNSSCGDHDAVTTLANVSGFIGFVDIATGPAVRSGIQDAEGTREGSLGETRDREEIVIDDKKDEGRKYVSIEAHCIGMHGSLKNGHCLEFANEADLSERISCHNGTDSSNAITSKLSSENFVDKIYRSNGLSEKNAKGSSGGLHSKDNAGLKNFYRTIKIKSLMNRSRTYRDKLY